MNHTCNGTYWPSIRTYRCLLDGTCLTINDSPTLCPNCKRDARPKVAEKAVLRTVVVREIQLDNDFVEVSRTVSPA